AALAPLAEISRSDVFTPDEVDFARGGHHCDEHILASDFGARFEARLYLCACRTLSQRTDAFLWQSGAVTGAIAFYRACDRLGSDTARAQGHGLSISGDKIDPPKDGFAGANN